MQNSSDSLPLMVDRNPANYYLPSQEQREAPWLLVKFVNQWFNVIDLRIILRETRNIALSKLCNFGGYIQVLLSNFTSQDIERSLKIWTMTCGQNISFRTLKDSPLPATATKISK